MGIPVVGCDCKVCSSDNSRNKRRRCAALVKIENKRFLIDVGPDFRTQALEYDIKRLDGLILTHTHFDHIAGLDDLRIFCFLQDRPLPALLSQSAYEDLKRRYYYLFECDKAKANTVVKLDWQVMERDEGEVSFEGVSFKTVSYVQAGMKVIGYLFGDLAYVTDIQAFDDALVQKLKGVKTLICNALRERDSKVHLTISKAVEFAKLVGAERTYFTHVDHEADAETTKLPDGMELAYDGLELEFDA